MTPRTPYPLPATVTKATFATQLYPSFTLKHALARLNRLINRRHLLPALEAVGYARHCRYIGGEAQLILYAARNAEENAARNM